MEAKKKQEQIRQILEIKEQQGLQMLALDQFRFEVEIFTQKMSMTDFLEKIKDKEERTKLFALARGSQ